jgi:hypothetical protein
MSETAGSVGVPPPEMLRSLSGIEYLQRIVDGRLPRPPITETLGLAIREVAPGFALLHRDAAVSALQPHWYGARGGCRHAA